MHKFCDVQLFAMDNFICTHERFECPQYVFDHDNINLMFVTDTHAVFCQPSREGTAAMSVTVRDATFNDRNNRVNGSYNAKALVNILLFFLRQFS